MDTLLIESFYKLLAGVCTPAAVREAERSLHADALWAQIEASGFLDLMVSESAGGGGAGLREAFGLCLACGRHALPVPLAQTLWLRAVMAQVGIAVPLGPMTLASQLHVGADGALHSQAVPFGLLARWVLVPTEGGASLLPLATGQARATGVHGSLQAHCTWTARPKEAMVLPADISVLHVGALLSAALMAGAMHKVLDTTAAYANERAQFGKSIGKFQAVQQQLSVMAEQVFAARMAAEIGCASDGTVPHPLRAAVAKARASEAAEKVVAIAHAVHGAIGITADFDLQLYTRRLQEWRGDFGSQAYWNAQLGSALLATPQTTTLTFLLEEMTPR